MNKTFQVSCFEDFASQVRKWLWLIISEVDTVTIQMSNVVLSVKTKQNYETFYAPVKYLFGQLIPPNQITTLYVSITWSKS